MTSIGTKKIPFHNFFLMPILYTSPIIIIHLYVILPGLVCDGNGVYGGEHNDEIPT